MSATATAGAWQPADSPTRLAKATTIGPWLLLALPLLFWLVLFVALPPSRQNFPLNDDWAYSKGAFAFARGDGIHYYHQGSMPLLGQWLVVWPLIKLFGESHAVLRLATIFLAMLGVVAFDDLLRRGQKLPREQVAFASAALALSPLFFVLSGTFLSDVPALAASLIALALYTRARMSGRHSTLAAAAVVAVLATVNRQNAVAAPLAIGVWVWRDRERRWDPAWVLAVLLPVAAGFVANAWFAARPDAVPLLPRLPDWRRSFIVVFTALHTMGLGALPVMVFKPLRGSRVLFLLFLVVLLDAAYAFSESTAGLTGANLFPYLGNLLTPWGVFDTRFIVLGERPLLLGNTARWCLTVAGCVGAAALLTRLSALFHQRTPTGRLGAFTVIHLAILLFSPVLFDRYEMVLVPGAIALAAGTEEEPARWRFGFPALFLVGLISMGLMHDWLSWNSARWNLGRQALARGIAASDLEGGLEWDSWYAQGPVAHGGTETSAQGLTLMMNHRRQPRLTGRYGLSFSLLPETRIIGSKPYVQWLPPGRHDFLLLERWTGGP